MNKGFKGALLAVILLALIVLTPSPAVMEDWSLAAVPYGVAVAAAALAAVLMLSAQRRYMQREEKAAEARTERVDTLTLALCCIPAGLIGARLLYCLVRFDFYFIEMGPLSVARTWEGGFLLYGAMAGVMLTAAALAKKQGVPVVETLDELAAPGLLAIAISRLFEGTTSEGVGAWVENEALWHFPFAVENEYGEWQLAVFVLEALAAVIILMCVLRVHGKPGKRIETALLLYACCQVILESMRMDGCLKIGFVRVSQVISALVILAVTMLRANRAGGKKAAAWRGAIVLACAGMVGGIEWALDKTPVSNVILYAAMTVVCAGLMANGLTAERTGTHGRA